MSEQDLRLPGHLSHPAPVVSHHERALVAHVLEHDPVQLVHTAVLPGLDLEGNLVEVGDEQEHEGEHLHNKLLLVVGLENTRIISSAYLPHPLNLHKEGTGLSGLPMKHQSPSYRKSTTFIPDFSVKNKTGISPIYVFQFLSYSLQWGRQE